MLLGLQAFVGATGLLWPLVLAGVGVALLWRQADEAQRERWLNPAGGVGPLRAVFGTGTWSSYLRVAAGVVLVAAAATLAAVNDEGLSVARDVAFSALLGIAGVAVVIGPWVFRLASDLGAERAERIRTQERADVAAHLHDSVLQTLALIQRNAADPETVSRLARAQERELRTWLYVGEEGTDETVAGALREAAARVEDEHGAVVDVVTVGDTVAGPGLRALVLAAQEAMVNAAKHAGTARVDVYAETGPESVEVFVRDRGVGFDLDAVPQDRLGVRGSIMDRMARHGGTADGAVRARRGHRGAAVDAARGEEERTGVTGAGPGVRVVVVDDHAMFRAGVRAELAVAGKDQVDVVAEAADVDEAVRVIRDEAPDVVLLDVHLPGGGGVEVMRRTVRTEPRFLALSVSDAAEDVIGTIRGGARGYVTKTITGAELVDAIRRVADGDAVFSPRLAGFVLDAFSGSIEVAAVDEDLDRLTEREREVMRLIARGYAYKEVARELFISVKTVETHMSSVLRKLQLSSRHELTRWASDRRLL